MSSAATARPKVVFGGGVLGGKNCRTATDAKAWTDLFRSFGHDTIDSARSYPVEQPGQSEALAAACGATAWCVLDTKVESLGEKGHSREKLLDSIEQSLRALRFEGGGKGNPQVDIMYLHAPCLDVPYEETVEAMTEAHKRGMFRRFGLSNYSPAQVEEMVGIAKKNGWLQPTVYQGHYNPICRKGEKELFPVLRKHGIAFYAYSPSGGGIFSGKVTAESIHDPNRRWSHASPIGKWLSAVYLRPELLDAAHRVSEAAKKHGMNGHEAALRWVLHHSALEKDKGDGMIIAASSLQQFQDNLNMCEHGPLPEDVVKAVEDVWPLAEPVAPWAWMEPTPDLINALKDTQKE